MALRYVPEYLSEDMKIYAPCPYVTTLRELGMTDATSPSEDNRAGYDRWAQIYDDYINSTVAVDDSAFPPLWAHVHDRNVLEIGCGTGRHTRRLAAADNRVTGLDISPQMLKLAKSKLSEFPNVRLLEADFMADDLGFVDFDVVVTALVLEHIADLDVFFLRVADALKLGGSFYLSEIHPDRIKGGTQANFRDPETGEAVKLTSFAHAATDIETAALSADLSLTSITDIIGDESLVAQHEDWRRHVGKPMIRMWVFDKL